MPSKARHLYQFSGIHSLLIGLLPFFIPVLLWNNNGSLLQICTFIAVSGIGFITTLWFWDRLRFQQRWGRILVLSFLSEILLVLGLVLKMPSLAFVLLALINGAYSCFYWSTQRTLFNYATSEHIHENNTGRTFGNFQILVVILLKLGILIGGYLHHNQGGFIILTLSAAISLFALLFYKKQYQLSQNKFFLDPQFTANQPPLSLTEIKNFKDANKSRLIFFLDGPFLFLESYFWVLSLYFLTQQNILQLSIIVVSLTLLLSTTFYFIKNRIDRLNQQKVFTVAVILYGLSWWLRATLNIEQVEWVIYPMIIVIAFLTTFFRLSFNKRFFDMARNNTPYRYFILKSYYSQYSLSLFFGGLAILLAVTAINTEALNVVYWLAGAVSLLYGIYAIEPMAQTSKGCQNY